MRQAGACPTKPGTRCFVHLRALRAVQESTPTCLARGPTAQTTRSESRAALRDHTSSTPLSQPPAVVAFPSPTTTTSETLYGPASDTAATTCDRVKFDPRVASAPSVHWSRGHRHREPRRVDSAAAQKQMRVVRVHEAGDRARLNARKQAPAASPSGDARFCPQPTVV